MMMMMIIVINIHTVKNNSKYCTVSNKCIMCSGVRTNNFKKYFYYNKKMFSAKVNKKKI